MSALSDFLKKNGATDADLEQMKPLLESKFASTLDGEITGGEEARRAAAEASGKLNEFESQRNQFEVQAQEATKKEKELRDWWETQAAPSVEKIRRDAINEAARAAALESRLAKVKDLYGFEIPDDVPATGAGSPAAGTPTAPGTAAASTQPGVPAGFDPTKYVTTDVLNQQADMVGSAIATAQNLAFEHTRLFPDRQMDFEALRTKAVQEKRPIREIWEREFNVAGRRAELQAEAAAKQQAVFDAKVEAARREGFEQGLSKSINPQTREAMPSRVGVVFAKRDQQSDAARPWDNANGRETGRLEKVISTLARSGNA